MISNVVGRNEVQFRSHAWSLIVACLLSCLSIVYSLGCLGWGHLAERTAHFSLLGSLYWWFFFFSWRLQQSTLEILTLAEALLSYHLHPLHWLISLRNPLKSWTVSTHSGSYCSTIWCLFLPVLGPLCLVFTSSGCLGSINLYKYASTCQHDHNT